MSEEGTVRVWNAVTGAQIAASKHEKSVVGAKFDATGERVLSWSEDGIVRVWDAVTDAQIAAYKHEEEIIGAEFDATGKRVVSWSWDFVIRIWNAMTGVEIAASRHEEIVLGAVFDATGERVLFWSWDFFKSQEGITRIWNTVTGTELVTIQEESAIFGAVFDATGERVLSWGEDGIARVWDVSWSVPRPSNRSLIAEVCTRKLRGPDTLLNTPFVNGSGETITHDSVRRISTADADFAPILKNRIGEDVCASPSWWRAASDKLLRLLPSSDRSSEEPGGP